jgi:YfiH family protein
MKRMIKDWSSFFSSEGAIEAWTSLRTGGVSSEDYADLNLSFDVAEPASSVLENRDRVRQLLSSQVWIEASQVHQTRCLWIENLDLLTSLKHPKDPATYLVGEADALITRTPGLSLVVKHADCQPGLIYDPVTGTIAAVHAGWRGLTAGIYEKCLQTMQEKGSDLKDIKILVGPSLQACCAEFKNWQQELGQRARDFETEKLHFSLTQMLRQALLHIGIQQKNLYLDPDCTFCHQSLNQFSYYSYRRSQNLKTTGRHLSGICLRTLYH